jgi:hypothetical protein
MMIALAQEVIFQRPESGQHVVPSPPVETQLAPVIVIGRLSAHGDHGVDRRRPADHLAARISQRAAIEPRLRLGLEHPIGTRIADGEQITDRDVKPYPVVRPAGLKQQHPVPRILRQAVRDDAPRGPRADHDVIEFTF